MRRRCPTWSSRSPTSVRRKITATSLANRDAIWQASVVENATGGIDGFLVSVNHPASKMLGPGVMRTESQALALIIAQLNQHRGRSPVFLVPVDRASLVCQLYNLGARTSKSTSARFEASLPDSMES